MTSNAITTSDQIGAWGRKAKLLRTLRNAMASPNT